MPVDPEWSSAWVGQIVDMTSVDYRVGLRVLSCPGSDTHPIQSAQRSRLNGPIPPMNSRGWKGEGRLILVSGKS